MYSNLQHLIYVVSCMKLITLGQGHGMDNDDDDDDHDRNKLSFKNNLGEQKLLVVSLDGFRYDFLDISGTKTLRKLVSGGVHARSLTSSFITKTFPNHHSIATGLYEENHGIVANSMWDPDWDETFKTCSEQKCGRWYGGQPIWNSNELHGMDLESGRKKRHSGEEETPSKASKKTSGVMYWPGITANINNMTVTFVEKYIGPYSNDTKYMNLTQRFDKAISWFTHADTPANLVMIYYEFPDKLCHSHGPESKQVNDSVRAIDNDFDHLLKELEKKSLLNTTNILVVSDHGFADVDGYLYLEDCVKNISEYRVVDNSPIISIWPLDNDDNVDFLYNTISKCDGYVVYRNPSPQLIQRHYSHNNRIPPILVSTKHSENSAKIIITNRNQSWTTKGSHGWDNTWDRMHAVFLANGPAFRKGVSHEPINNVHIYPLMCTILDIDCPPSDGSVDAVRDMFLLEDDEGVDMATVLTVAGVALLCAFFSGIMIIGVCKLAMQKHRHLRLFNSSSSHGLKTIIPLNQERTTLLETSDEEF